MFLCSFFYKHLFSFCENNRIMKKIRIWYALTENAEYRTSLISFNNKRLRPKISNLPFCLHRLVHIAVRPHKHTV